MQAGSNILRTLSDMLYSLCIFCIFCILRIHQSHNLSHISLIGLHCEKFRASYCRVGECHSGGGKEEPDRAICMTPLAAALSRCERRHADRSVGCKAISLLRDHHPGQASSCWRGRGYDQDPHRTIGSAPSQPRVPFCRFYTPLSRPP
jgi:hypothetical protein